MNKFILVLVALITSVGCFAQSDLVTFNLKKGVTKCIGTMYDNPNLLRSLDSIINLFLLTER